MISTVKHFALAITTMIALAFGAPAMAQDAASDETVTVLYELQLTGEIPGWQVFVADHLPRGQTVDAGFCSTDPTYNETGWELCKPGTYSVSVEVPAGVPATVEFVRQDGNSSEVFFSETRVFAGGETVRATYHFDSTTDTDQYIPAENNGTTQHIGFGATGDTPDTSDQDIAADINDLAVTKGEMKELPNTGGSRAILLLAGATLIAGGLLTVRLARIR